MTLTSGCHASWENFVVPSVFGLLIHSGFEFHLTGSRFFKYHRGGESDFDFFIGVSPWQSGAPKKGDVTNFLNACGFELESTNKSPEYAHDTNIIEIWAYTGNPQIHVQIVASEALKHATHNILLKHFSPFSLIDLGYFTKPQRKKIWRLAQEYARLCLEVSKQGSHPLQETLDAHAQLGEAEKHGIALEAEEDYFPVVDDIDNSDGGE